MIIIPDKCKFIFEKLEYKGFECFAVGGCVRDSLRGVEPQDWDFTTNATPDEILGVFCDYRTIDIGKRFGTICVVDKGIPFEITTYRTESGYSDSRHPDSVLFTADITKDLSRRDFTMNSIAYNPKQGLVDPFNGLEDIQNKIIRCTGEPLKRFCEDALRIIRALRFSSVLGFSVEDKTSDSLLKCKERLKDVHPHRIKKELIGLICGKYASSVLDEYRDVVTVIIPELKKMFDCTQNNPHHKFDVWHHTLKALEYSPDDELLKFSVFFHDIGKPYLKTTDEKGVDHFKKHPAKSAEITESVLKHFGFTQSFVKDVKSLVLFHDERFKKANEDIKRVLNILGEDLIFKLFEISYCDISAQSDYKKDEKLKFLERVRVETERIISNNECYSLKDLDISGRDLLKLGFKGEQIGVILENLLKSVIKGKLRNEYKQLKEAAKSINL